MTCPIKSFLATVTALAIVGSASAEDSFTIVFDYSPDRPVAESFEALSKTALQGCRAQYGDVHHPIERSDYVRTCQEEMLGKVIAQIDDPALMALYRGDTGRGSSAAQFAQRN